MRLTASSATPTNPPPACASASRAAACGLKYSLKLEEQGLDGDQQVDCGAFTVLIDDASAPLLDGVTMDFVDSMEGSGFTFVNPNARSGCSCGKSFAC